IYEDKARGGAGLITYENTNPDAPLIISAGLAHIGTESEVKKYKKLRIKHDLPRTLSYRTTYGSL
ncbi:MAG: hypothetical protein ACTSPU_11895, partial [Promethearchaeota archaeon]